MWGVSWAENFGTADLGDNRTNGDQAEQSKKWVIGKVSHFLFVNPPAEQGNSPRLFIAVTARVSAG